MEVITPQSKKTLHEYDFVFTSGMVLPVIIDETLGDSVTFKEGAVIVFLSAKPGLTEDSPHLPEEEHTIFTRYLASIQHRKREVTDMTVEEKEAWKKTFQELSGTGSKLIN